MTASTITRPKPNPTDTTRNHELDKEITVNTMNIIEDIAAAPVGREPLAPDSPGPPGRDREPGPSDPSLAARPPVARCADGNGTLTGLFFSDHVVDIARAKAMCGLCPLKLECLHGALEREEPWGVWGGELLSGGRIVVNKRPCGRPPKHPRPDVVYDEMGPVGVVA